MSQQDRFSRKVSARCYVKICKVSSGFLGCGLTTWTSDGGENFVGELLKLLTMR